MEQLLAQIEELRQHMNRVALLYGINHPKVLEISLKLDDLLNKYARKNNSVAFFILEKK